MALSIVGSGMRQHHMKYLSALLFLTLAFIVLLLTARPRQRHDTLPSPAERRPSPQMRAPAPALGLKARDVPPAPLALPGRGAPESAGDRVEAFACEASEKKSESIDRLLDLVDRVELETKREMLALAFEILESYDGSRCGWVSDTRGDLEASFCRALADHPDDEALVEMSGHLEEGCLKGPS